jgi:hypothetical protein
MNRDELRARQAPLKQRCQKLLELTHRYCVVYQTLRNGVDVKIAYRDPIPSGG